MPVNSGPYKISKTFPNVIMTNLDIPSGAAQEDLVGLPASLLTAPQKAQGRLQDGSGTTTPLHLSISDVQVTSLPQTTESVARAYEVLEAATFAQTMSIIHS